MYKIKLIVMQTLTRVLLNCSSFDEEEGFYLTDETEIIYLQKTAKPVTD